MQGQYQSMLEFTTELQMMQEWKHFVDEWNQILSVVFSSVIPTAIYQVADLNVCDGNLHGEKLVPRVQMFLHKDNLD